MNRIATRLLAVLAAAALLVPASAHAATVVIDDAAGDAKALDYGAAFGEIFGGAPAEGPSFLDAPAETSTDVVRTTIDHARKRLTVTLQFRDLVDVDGHLTDLRIFTPAGRYDLTVASFDGQTMADLTPARSGHTIVFSDGVAGPGPGSKPCRTVRARYDVAADTLTASAPTACLQDPTWVQVAAGASRTRVTPQGDGSVNLAGFVDDAFRGGVSLNSLGRSPKVRRA